MTSLDQRYIEERARDALAFEPLPTSRYVSADEAGIVIATRYGERLSRLLASLPGARWVPERRHWRYPFSAAADIRRALPEIECLADAISEETDAAARQREESRVAAAEKAAAEMAATRESCGVPKPLRPEFLEARADRPRHDLALEAIGDNAAHQMFGAMRPAAWAAQIFGLDGRGRWVRSYLPGNRDYAAANSVGSRGIMVHFHLLEGPVYEICAPTSWRGRDRYFMRIVDGERRRLGEEGVRACLAS